MPSERFRRRLSLMGDGSAFAGPLHTISRRQGDDEEITYEAYAGHLLHRCDHVDDFLGDTLLDEVRVYDMSPSGSPTAAIQADGRNGILELTLASTNEYELLLYDWGTIQNIPATMAPVIDFVLNVKVLPVANNRIVFGLASQITLSQNNSLDADVDRNIWFRLDGDGDLLIESDDGTLDDDDNDTGVDLTADTWYLFRIDMRDINNIVFSYAEKNGEGWRQVGTLDAGELAVTDLLSPFIAVQKASGAGVTSLYVDLVRTSWDR